MKSQHGKFPANTQTDVKFQGQGDITAWVGRDLQDHRTPTSPPLAGTPSWIRKLKSSGFALEHVKKLYYFVLKNSCCIRGIAFGNPLGNSLCHTPWMQ